jgi:hypothetical protein
VLSYVTTEGEPAVQATLPVNLGGLGIWSAVSVAPSDDSTVRVAVGLCLGTQVCGAHTCKHCSAVVSKLGRHSLSCKRSEGRFQRHTALNDIIKGALSSAYIPSRLEPTGLLRSDGKRPDGVSVAVWLFAGVGATCLTPLPLPIELMQPLRLRLWQKTGRLTNTGTYLWVIAIAIESMAPELWNFWGMWVGLQMRLGSPSPLTICFSGCQLLCSEATVLLFLVAYRDTVYCYCFV